MRRGRVLLLCLLVTGATATPLVARSATTPTIDVRIAKTRAAVKPFGIVEPARPATRVIVRFAVDTGAGFQRVARKKVALDGATDSDGNGRRDSVFATSFARPDGGTCRIVAVFVRADGTRIRDRQVFACAVVEFGHGEASIVGDHEPVAVDLLIAETSEQHGYGLSFRRRLAAGRGMAFLFATDTSVKFWMKDTLIPLSIAFFDANGVILDIQDMDPCHDEPCPTHGPGQPYRGALEVNQGGFATGDVEVGDTIVITRQ